MLHLIYKRNVMINAKKVFPTIVLSLLTLSSVYAATNPTPQSSGNNQQNKSGTNLQQSKNKNSGVINPPARPILGNALDFFIDAEFIYWKTRETGLDFATKTTYPTSPFAPNSQNQFVNNYSGDVKNPHFKWDPGFRVGIGFNMPFDGWDVYLNWTWLHSKAGHGATSASPALGKRILPEFQPVVLPDQDIAYNYARPSWRLYYNNIDLELGREFFVSRRLTLRPNIGLRVSWLYQKFDINTQADGSVFILNASDLAIVNNYSLTNTVRMKNDFNGLGPRLGLDTEWKLGGGFSLYGDAAIALLLGDFKVQYDAKTDAFFTPTGSRTTESVGYTSLSNFFHDTRASTDLALGIRWSHRFADDSCRIRLEAGWESHLYFSQNQFISFENDVNPINTTEDFADVVPLTSSLSGQTLRRGDLSMQGLTLAVRFDF